MKWSNTEDDLVLVLIAGDEGSGLAKAARDTCPIACALLKGRLEAGKTINGSLNNKVRNRGKDGETLSGTRFTHIIPVSKGKPLQVREIYEGMVACNSIATWAGRSGINLAIQEGVDIDMVRKTAEELFRQGIERMKIYPPWGANKRANERVERRGENNKPSVDRVKKERQTEVITLSQEGKTYSDMLRLVKEKVKSSSVAAQGIRTIRESNEGKMVIVVEKKEKDAINELKEELNRIQNVRMRATGGRDTILMIKDMDDLVTKKEVEEVIGKELGQREAEYTIGDLRPYYGGNQAVTVRMDREQAEILLEKGKIKIGLNWCSVSEKVNVLECYRCWQYGHRSANCREGNGECCLSCKREGHGAGSGKCPLFRHALRRLG